MTTKDDALMREALNALKWYVKTDDVSETMPGNEYWVEGKRRAETVITKIEAALAEKPQEPPPPFGSKRKAAMAVYTPPFKYVRGYIYDSQNLMVADDDKVEDAVASRVRGWGRLSYLPNGAELQDEIGQMIADALTAYYAAPVQQSQDALDAKRYRTELGRAYRCIQGLHNALTAMKADIPGNGYHALTIAAAKRFIFEGALDGSEYFEGKHVSVLHAALRLPAIAAGENNHG